MKKGITFFTVFSLLFLFSGCATIFEGEFRDVKVNSEPAGAKIFINGEYYSSTPLKIELRPNKTYIIEYRKKGYKTITRRIKNQIGVGWVILDVVCGVIPVFVDAVTGAWYSLEQVYINEVLEEQNKPLP